MIPRRAMVGGAIIAAWLAGLATLVHREYFRPQLERLADAALRVTPGAVFFGVMDGSRQIGFASSTVDTTSRTITVNDYFVADLPAGDTTHRATARTSVVLTRALRMTSFSLALDTKGPPLRMSGRMEGDSALILAIASGAARPDTQRVALSGPVLFPTLVPIAVALTDQPKIGKRYLFPIFDPSGARPMDVAFDVRAESLFVVDDSATFDTTAQRWHGVQPDTVHAWQVATDSTSGVPGLSAWIDGQGRLVQTAHLGLVLRRMPYEVAFENWHSGTMSPVPAVPVP